jgi:LysM repeat protein
VPAGGGAHVVAALGLVPPAGRASWRLHRVTEGDTLEAIASRYRTTAQRIAAANSSDVADLTPGSLLIVPATPPPPKPAAKPTVASVLKRASPAAKPGVASPAKSAGAAASDKARQTSKTPAPNAKPPLAAAKKASASNQASGATH